MAAQLPSKIPSIACVEKDGLMTDCFASRTRRTTSAQGRRWIHNGNDRDTWRGQKIGDGSLGTLRERTGDIPRHERPARLDSGLQQDDEAWFKMEQ